MPPYERESVLCCSLFKFRSSRRSDRIDARLSFDMSIVRPGGTPIDDIGRMTIVVCPSVGLSENVTEPDSGNADHGGCSERYSVEEQRTGLPAPVVTMIVCISERITGT